MTCKQSQKGFTLVELAIVLMIIGLLIGGVLRGQELYQNAKITDTVKQLQAYQAAYVTFVDTYNNIPGDMANPGSYLPNCTTAPCNNPGDGNGFVDQSHAPYQEFKGFWVHLSHAHLITAVNETGTLPRVWSPKSSINNNSYFTVGTQFMTNSTNNLKQNSLGISGFNGDDIATSNGSYTNTLSPRIAAQLDRKMDDGLPNSGSVFVLLFSGTPNSNTTCEDGTKYNETLETELCFLIFPL